MLRNLVVKNYALIENLTVDFCKGLNVITGETGAGKSIVIDALSLVLGNRGNKSNIRQGEKKMIVQGLFDIDYNAFLIEKSIEFGIPMDDQQLILTREIDNHGKNICRANGIIITVSQLKIIGNSLMDIHGQHEHQSLFQRENHRILLDAFAGVKSSNFLEILTNNLNQLKILEAKINELEINERVIEREKETLQFELNEIKEANLKIDEEEELENEKRIFENRERLFSNINNGYELLRGETAEQRSILDGLGELQHNLSEAIKIDSNFEENLELINGVYGELESLLFGFRSYLEDMEYSLGDLDVIEERLSIISQMKRKYGSSIAEVIDYEATICTRLKTLINRDENLEIYKNDYQKIKKKYCDTGKKLHDLRLKAGKNLKKELELELADLAMDKVKVEIKVDYDHTRLTFNGQDQIEFLISVNPGQDPKPLGKIASGGEISRIMLSLKSIFGSMDAIETMVFDEIDTGISGRTAQIVAEKIQALTVTPPNGRQIICITHLPQIAAMADQHFMVEKLTGETSVDVFFLPLDEKGKKEELVRMLGGVELTQKTWDHAQEMLELSQKVKKSKKK
jgi:DNA repair protein RecN (Recombination protein N)